MIRFDLKFFDFLLVENLFDRSILFAFVCHLEHVHEQMDYKVDAKKLKQVFKMAGKVVSVDLATDKDGASRGFAVVEYEHPVEAVQAISMFDRQQLFERRMTVRLDRVPDKNEGIKLPEGLKGIGLGLGNDFFVVVVLVFITGQHVWLVLSYICLLVFRSQW